MREKRQPHNRLGFAIQLTSVRYLGRFMPDPRQVPAEVVEYLAEQLEIADPSCLKDYGERDGTARTHAGEIQNSEGWRDFSEVINELAEWLDARAWTTGDGPKALFDAAVGWLCERKVLLPGVTRLARLLAETPYSGPAQPGARIKLISSVNSRWVKASRSLESSVAVAVEVAPAGAVGGHDEMGGDPLHGFGEATVVVAVSFGGLSRSWGRCSCGSMTLSSPACSARWSAMSSQCASTSRATAPAARCSS